MILYNPKPNKAKGNLVIAAIVIVNMALTACMVFAVFLMFTGNTYVNIPEVWLTWPLLASVPIGIFLYWLLNKLLMRLYDRYRASVNIKGYGIALCECGKYFRPSDIQYQMSVSTKYKDTTVVSEKRTINLTCTCSVCNTVRKDYISEDGGSLSDEQLEKKVREKYEHDVLHAHSLMRHYESLGYYMAEPVTSECSIKKKKSVKGKDRTAEIIESIIEKDCIKKK